mgnify:CR=1 FL=1
MCEISYENKKCFIISLYRSPSQNADEFQNFLKELESILESISTVGNPNLIFVIGDFNAKLSAWKTDDPDTPEGLDISALTSSYGLTQIITEPTHILPNSNTCIDLLFTNQPNIVSESGVYPTLHNHCHHQLIYAKINFKTYFPPPYERLVWHYSRAKVENIRMSLDRINWEREFHDLTIDKQVELFNNHLLNICYNYIPHETITINDKDPPWIDSIVKKKIEEKNFLHKNYLRYGKRRNDLDMVNEACRQLSVLISEKKTAYCNRLSDKLSNHKTSAKAY